MTLTGVCAVTANVADTRGKLFSIVGRDLRGTSLGPVPARDTGRSFRHASRPFPRHGNLENA